MTHTVFSIAGLLRTTDNVEVCVKHCLVLSIDARVLLSR
jgi:hypothetical protein